MYDRPKSISIIISSKGYLEPNVETSPYGNMNTRDGANLKFTRNDGDGILELWKNQDEFEPIILINPTLNEVKESFEKADRLLSTFEQGDTGIDLFFAGHGENLTGSLVLKDGIFSCNDLISLMSKNLINSEAERGLSFILDSCYSGSFLIDIIILTNSTKCNIKLFDTLVSSMHDEPSYEISFLEHGVFTFSRICIGNSYADSKLLKEAIENNNHKIIAKYMQGLVATMTSPVTYLTQGKQHEIDCFKGDYFNVGNGGSFTLSDKYDIYKITREDLILELTNARKMYQVKE